MVKKESPNMGTKTGVHFLVKGIDFRREKRIPKHGDENFLQPSQRNDCLGSHVKKESPNMGTKTLSPFQFPISSWKDVKKESPNMGTKTTINGILAISIKAVKKESPNMGTKTNMNAPSCSPNLTGVKKESPNMGTKTTRISFS